MMTEQPGLNLPIEAEESQGVCSDEECNNREKHWDLCPDCFRCKECGCDQTCPSRA